MRRTVVPFAAALALAAALVFPFASIARAQQPASQQAAPPQSAQAPHAFLFGAWTGGLFPPPSSVTAPECLGEPTIIFTRDVVLRATLTDVLYVQRAVETARGTGQGIDIHFVAAGAQQAAPAALGLGTPGLGFGCETPDVLHVRRLSENEISFPGCREFPFPLVRCPAG